jgi:hypothetical protein
MNVFTAQNALRVLGVMILLAAWLIDETEEGWITSKIEIWRQSVEKKRSETKSAIARDMQTIAAMISRLLDKLFGKAFFSLDVVYMSTCLSAFGFVLAMPLAFALTFKTNIVLLSFGLDLAGFCKTIRR